MEIGCPAVDLCCFASLPHARSGPISNTGARFRSKFQVTRSSSLFYQVKNLCQRFQTPPSHNYAVCFISLPPQTLCFWHQNIEHQAERGKSYNTGFFHCHTFCERTNGYKLENIIYPTCPHAYFSKLLNKWYCGAKIKKWAQ
jgi:hypothetical protein